MEEDQGRQNRLVYACMHNPTTTTYNIVYRYQKGEGRGRNRPKKYRNFLTHFPSVLPSLYIYIYIIPKLRIQDCRYQDGKGSRATLEGPPREHGGSNKGAGESSEGAVGTIKGAVQGRSK